MREWGRSTSWVVLGAILVAAALLRLPALGEVPPGLWFDEALNAQDAWAVWQPGGGLRWVYADVFPREPMFQTLLALAVRVGGPSVVVLRAVPVIIGLLTVLLLYLALRRETGEAIALAAAGVLATMRWHAIFSRLIFRTLVLPVWIIGLVWAALAWRRQPTAGRALAFGVMLGGGFYTYLSWYFMLPLAVTLGLWIARIEWAQPGGRRRLALAGLAALAVFAPIGIHYLHHPEHLLARPGAVSPFSVGLGPGVREIGENLADGMLMLHWRGDHVPVQNIPEKPGLDPIQGLVFVWGLVLCLGALRRTALAPILLLWILCGLAPSVFTLTDSPNFLRSLVMTPAVAVVTGWGLVDLARRLAGPRRGAVAGLIALALSASALLSANDIYRVWPRRDDVWSRFHGAAVQVGRFAAAAPADAAVFVPEPFNEGRPFQFMTLGAQRIYSYGARLPLEPWPPTADAAADPPPARRLLIVPADRQLLTIINELVGEAAVVEEFKTPAGVVWAVAVEFKEP